MAKSGVKVVRDDVAKMMKSLDRLMGLDVLVGIPSDKASRDDDGPLNNAQIGYIQTYGSTIQVPEKEASVNRRNGKFSKAKKATSTTSHTVPAHEIVIPPRPFLEPGVVNAEPKTTPRLAKAMRAVLSGDSAGAEIELNKAGLEAVSSVRSVITGGIAPELAESTKRRRRAKGRTGETPLLDTGELNNSISYVVRKK
jgi:hypothetical protein